MDEHHQQVGAEAFNRFQRYAYHPPPTYYPHPSTRRVNNLDTEVRLYHSPSRTYILSHIPQLRNFSNAARQLGSSVGILSSAYHLRERLAHLLHLFRDNAADLFPRKVPRQARDAPLPMPRMSTSGRKLRRPPPHVKRPPTRFDAEDLDPEAFPGELHWLSREVMTFLNCLNEFPEFSDEAVNTNIQSFEGDLKVRCRLNLHLWLAFRLMNDAVLV